MNMRHFKQIDRLRGWRETAFLAALAERNSINLAVFARLVTSDGASLPGADAVLHSLELVWRRLIADQPFRPMRRLPELEALAEQLGEQDSFGAEAAEVACELIREALLSIENDHIKRAQRAARRSLDLVVRYEELRLGDMPENDLIRALDESEAVQVELAFQEAVCRQLQALKGPDPEVLESLRALANQEGVSNLGITDVPEGER